MIKTKAPQVSKVSKRSKKRTVYSSLYDEFDGSNTFDYYGYSSNSTKSLYSGYTSYYSAPRALPVRTVTPEQARRADSIATHMKSLLKMNEQAVFDWARRVKGIHRVVDKAGEDGWSWYVNSGTRPSGLCLVAHVDTVCREIPDSILYKDYRLFGLNNMVERCILGGDDRCGVLGAIWIATSLGLRGIKCHILLTNGEESGGRGVRSFCSTHKHLITENIKYMIELDRKGDKEAVCYSWKQDAEMERALKAIGFSSGNGSYSDVSTLTDITHVPHWNFSIGYWNQHTAGEYIDLVSMYSCMTKVMEFQRVINVGKVCLIPTVKPCVVYSKPTVAQNKCPRCGRLNSTYCTICGCMGLVQMYRDDIYSIWGIAESTTFMRVTLSNGEFTWIGRSAFEEHYLEHKAHLCHDCGRPYNKDTVCECSEYMVYYDETPELSGFDRVTVFDFGGNNYHVTLDNTFVLVDKHDILNVVPEFRNMESEAY